MAKLKMKSNRAARKRFKVTATGKVRYAAAFKNHILTCKNRKRKRQAKGAGVQNTTDSRRNRKLIGEG